MLLGPGVVVTELVGVDVAVGVPQLLSRIDTLLEAPFATARSSKPSPLKSATATEWGVAPAAKFIAAPKLPVPVPNRIDTLLEVAFATARSSPSVPLKSPTASEIGIRPRGEIRRRPEATGAGAQ